MRILPSTASNAKRDAIYRRRTLDARQASPVRSRARSAVPTNQLSRTCASTRSSSTRSSGTSAEWTATSHVSHAERTMSNALLRRFIERMAC
ncbi:MAG: hypothetical protein AUI11_12545 [Acidobacteria bacterium 13_2_20CM_2_66_4]|nr:MAG: hypothetical protein AUI11_12545 [Acidobacteria bacterium 13_2_20CM_2_66_4]